MNNAKTLPLVFAIGLALLCVAQLPAQEDATAAEVIEKHKTGGYEITPPGVSAPLFLQASRNYGESPKAELANGIANGEIPWITNKSSPLSYLVDAPETYQPGNPHGVIVFISSSPKGRSPYPSHLSEHNLISISAKNSGNKTGTALRHATAVQAVHLIAERYDIDPERIYVSGLSGGGRVISQVMMMNSDLFTGGIPIIGANPCIPMTNADSSGKVYSDSGAWPKPDRKLLMNAAKFGRYAFVTGEKDYNKKNVKLVAEGYQKAGFQYVTYLEEPGLKHGMPSEEYITKAIEFLDAPLVAAADSNYEAAKKKLASEKLGDAMKLFQKAVSHGKDADWKSDAEAQSTELKQQYETARAAVETAIEITDKKALKKSLTELAKKWAVAPAELKVLKKRFSAAAKAAAK